SGSSSTENADVHGRFDGDLVVRNRLIIRATGHVAGKISYGEVEIERGGKLSGVIKAQRRFCGAPNSPAIRATWGLGVRCSTMRATRCRGRAPGSPISMSSLPRL